MSEFVAYANKIEIKTGMGRNNKPYTVYNVHCVTKTGESVRLGWGFDAPSFKEGQWFQTQVETNARGYQEKVKGAPVQAKDGPAPASTGASQGTGASGSSSAPASNARQDSIHYQNSRTAAIQLTGLLLEANALPISTAKDKGGITKRFDQLQAVVEKLTVQLYHDVDTLRLLEKHADAGEVEVPKAQELPEPAPEDEETPSVPEETQGDIDWDDDIPF